MSTELHDKRRSGQRARRGRSVPVLYGGVSLVLVALALTFALSSPPPSTPPLAEVAPAPQDQIEVERVEQSSRFGEGQGGEGDCVAGDPGCEDGSAGALPAGTEVDRRDVVQTGSAGSFRHCFNGGLTQTEDPQSPPCIAEVFTGDNGGATARGVTAAAITVAVPLWASDAGDEAHARPIVEALFAHVNHYYERYGRTLEPVYVDLQGRRPRTPEDARALAQEVDALGTFAALEIPEPLPAYFRELASSGVVVTSGTRSNPLPGVDDTARWGSTFWSVFPSLGSSLRATGDLACTALVGRPAQHAGDPALTGTERHLGVLVQAVEAGRVDPAGLTDRLAACGASFDTYEEGQEHGSSDASAVEPLLRRMQADGVTTVVCACAEFDVAYTQGAENVGFRPEWLLPFAGAGDGGATTQYKTAHVDAQQRHAFGITAGLREPGADPAGSRQRHEEQFWYRAAVDEDPGLAFDQYDKSEDYYGYYAQLLVLASGIQHAGPDLTADAFALALESLRFPNPGVGTAPWWQPAVGFSAGEHELNSDFALWWIDLPDVHGERSDAARARVKVRRCYVGSGLRFTPGGFPGGADDLFFDPEAGCR